MIDVHFAAKIQEVLDAAVRLASERSIVQASGTIDGQIFEVAVGVGPGAAQLRRILRETCNVDPRSMDVE